MKHIGKLALILYTAISVVACGSDQSNTDAVSDDGRTEGTIVVNAKSNSANEQAPTIEVFLNGAAVSTGPVSISSGADKAYSFPATERLDDNSIIDVVIRNEIQRESGVSISSVQANNAILNPSKAYFDAGIKEAAFDGLELSGGSSIIPSDGALRFLVGATEVSETLQEEKESLLWCTGKPNQNLDSARRSFRTECGQPYDDQNGHKCDYKPNGFHCNGMVAESDGPSKPEEDIASSEQPLRPGHVYCYGVYEDSIGNAKSSVPANCGVGYPTMRAHQCVWSSRGWRCGGQVPKGTIPAHPYSSLCQRYDTFFAIRPPIDLVVSRIRGNQMLMRWKAQDCENEYFNIYQNGRKVESNHPRNYLIRKVPVDQTIEFQVATLEYLHRRYYKSESPKTDPVSFQISTKLSNCDQIGSSTGYRCDSNLALLKGAMKSGSMVVVPIGTGGETAVLYSGPLDSQGLCTLHVPGGSEESVSTGIVGWKQIESANDSCHKDSKSCGGGNGGGGASGGGNTVVDTGGNPVVDGNGDPVVGG